jgi:uncharacterized membrane protein
LPRKIYCSEAGSGLPFDPGTPVNDSRLPAALYVLLLVLGVQQWVRAYPQLPPIMASHFDASGTPNGWQPKQAFFLVSSVVMVMTGLTSFVMPHLLNRLSPKSINLPHKAYWLAPERRAETWQYFGAQMAWFGCALLFLLLYAVSLAINANLPSIGHFDSRGMWYVIVAFFFFSIIWTVRFLRHFYNAPPSDSFSSSNPF